MRARRYNGSVDLMASTPEELTVEQTEELAMALAVLRDELRAFLKTSADSAKTVDLDQPIGRVSRIDAIQQQKMAQAQRARQVVRLDQVDAALRKVRDDEYGYCNKCDEPIGYKRLKSKPESPLCMPCQTALERR